MGDQVRRHRARKPRQRPSRRHYPALVLIVVVWTGSYLFRVVTGQMTYMEQRRRYREVYDEQEADDLQKRFDALPPEEQQALLQKIGMDESDAPSGS